MTSEYGLEKKFCRIGEAVTLTEGRQLYVLAHDLDQAIKNVRLAVATEGWSDSRLIAIRRVECLAPSCDIVVGETFLG